jgi:hypothetical protein
MYLEYDWTFNVYRARLGQTFTDVLGHRSWPSRRLAVETLARCGLRLGRKTDTRSWPIEAAGPGACIL